MRPDHFDGLPTTRPSDPRCKNTRMGSVQKSVATLRIWGDDLVPDQVSSQLGCPPTASHQKGDIIVGGRTSRTGEWSLRSTDHEPENLDSQIVEILSKVTNDLDVWGNLVSSYRVDLFCGLFMASVNDGITLSSSSLTALGQRGIELSLDMYGPEEV
jgi:hypothetical protein